jgi:hypothetical protein
MRGIANSNLRDVIAVVVMAASCTALGCSSNAQPADLTAPAASALISQKWSGDELNHFSVILHSDTLIECGVKNDLWKLVETVDRGYTRRVYQLTEKGNKVVFAVDLKESGKGHEITLRGPYRFEIASITPGSQPDARVVDFRWDIDWGKAPADLKACLPKFELTGHEVALFKLSGPDWKFASYLKPEDVPAQPAGAGVAPP